MNELIPMQKKKDGTVKFSGRDLHEFLEIGSQYTKWFERMSEYGFVEGVDYIAISQKRLTAQGNNTTFMDHEMTIDMAKEISMIQRNERGKQARQYFIHVEKLWNSPEMIVQRAMEIQQQKIVQLEGRIERDQPYTTFGKVVANSDASINVGAFAKLMYDKHGINIGRNKLFSWLRDKGYLIKSGRERNQPKQKYLEQGLFDTTTTLVTRTHGDVQSVTTFVTGRGQVVIAKKLIEEFDVKQGVI